jgi:hypothetical protein
VAKQSKNLSLDREAVQRGERYSALHGTNLSQLVTNFLLSLPVSDEEPPLSPTVRRLLGVGSGDVTLEDYHRHLEEKYVR